MKTLTKKLTFDTPLHLKCGGALKSFDLMIETYGELNQKKDNAVLVCHAFFWQPSCCWSYRDWRETGFGGIK